MVTFRCRDRCYYVTQTSAGHQRFFVSVLARDSGYGPLSDFNDFIILPSIKKKLTAQLSILKGVDIAISVMELHSHK